MVAELADEHIYFFCSQTTAAFFDKISLSATGYYRYDRKQASLYIYLFINQVTVTASRLCLRGPDLYMDWVKMEGQPYAYYTYGVCCSEVELDCLTGDYRVRTETISSRSTHRDKATFSGFKRTFLFCFL